MFIMEKMLSVIAAPKSELSPYAPRIVTLKIKKECVEDFLKVMETDMIESRKEAGCLRFDVLRQDDPKPGDGEGVEM
jgi:polyribonucleotide nucleotidyltransferase